MAKKVKIALALGGGGVRGLAHIGVIRALQEQGVHIDMIAGTSMGAMIGAQYALDPNISTIERRMLAMLDRKEIRAIEKLISGYSPSDEKKLIINSLFSFVKQMVMVNVRAIKRWVFSGKEIFWIFEHLELNTDFKKCKILFAVQVWICAQEMKSFFQREE